MKIENPEFLRRVENLEKLLDYNFKDKSLLLAAITHRSFVAEYPVKLKDYEVLEFLGDSVLSLIVSEILIKQFPDAREGDLSQLRSAIVSEAYLSKLAKLLNLGQFVLISKGEKSQKGSERDSLLCDVFEAVFGAIYIDTDYNIDTPRNVFNKLFKEKLLQDIKTENIPRDYKSLLQIETQKLYGKIPKYRLIHSEGPEHDKVFVVECEIEKIKTTGKGKSKKEAETQAAKEAFRKIKE
ncbi:ribonuclease III [Sulfurihydrogenibium azorense Az-Fu1]|jgi:ribonuclease-3|uniref:Ribonuclease 3 n=1 Tax=Sulfurihydrogenibium azorense (strain DSM 15241 / OCM 825 / Az-Fu1) TaxID=204536 RepID=C1DXE0_SULAA|nr:ribonuclease III [Sulfurihydrogenibium azorense]ACN99415.1 ribonuclease III [Sulfurihydrogenibium azorense Az-Fu1]